MLFHNFVKFAERHGLVSEGDSIVVAVSGGADSMVLLDLFLKLADRKKLEIKVAHVNYFLRGADSNADEALVRRVAKEHGVECVVLKKKLCGKTNIQELARNIRFKFLKKVAMDVGADSVATAHHSDDQSETVLIHLLRGSGLKGLSGMRPEVPLGDIKLVRPLLFATRAQIEKYALKHKIDFHDDATNAGQKYFRNTIRHRLIPMLKEFNPRIVENLCALANKLALDEEVLAKVAKDAIEGAIVESSSGKVWLKRRIYLSFPKAIRYRILRLVFETISGSSKDLNADQLNRMDLIALGERGKGAYRLPAPWKFFREGEILHICRCQTRCDR